MDFHSVLGRATRHQVTAVVLFTGLSLAYICSPLLKTIDPEANFDPEKSLPANHVTLFFIRDVSLSVNSTSYDAIEATVHDVLRQRYDSIFYGLFANDTFPQLMNQFWKIDSGRRTRDLLGDATRIDHRRTNFARLFSRLADAVGKPVSVDPKDSTEIVVVLSDGMPDLETRDRQCPDEATNLPLIDDQIKDSYKALTLTAAASKRNLWVILVLNGGLAKCADVVRSGWEVGLDSEKFRITDKENVLDEILTITGRSFQGHLNPIRPMSSDFDRELKAAVKTGEFSISYIPWSFGEGGSKPEVTVESARLMKDDDTQVGMLYPVSGREVSAQSPDTRVQFPLLSPAPGSLYWKGSPLDIVFQLRGTPRLEEVQRYKVVLDTKPDDIVTAGEANVLGKASEPTFAVWEHTLQTRDAAVVVLLIYAAVAVMSLKYKDMPRWIVSLCFTAAFGVTISIVCACVSLFHQHLAWSLPCLSIAAVCIVAILRRKESNGGSRIELEHIALAVVELFTILLAAKLQ